MPPSKQRPDGETSRIGALRHELNKNQPVGWVESGTLQLFIDEIIGSETPNSNGLLSLFPLLLRRTTACLTSGDQAIAAQTRSIVDREILVPSRITYLTARILQTLSSPHKPDVLLGSDIAQALANLCLALGQTAALQPLFQHALAAPRNSKSNIQLLSQILPHVGVEQIPVGLLQEMKAEVESGEIPGHCAKIVVILLRHPEYLSRLISEGQTSGENLDPNSLTESVLLEWISRPNEDPATVDRLLRHIFPPILSAQPHTALSLLTSLFNPSTTTPLSAMQKSSNLRCWTSVAAIATTTSILSPSELPVGPLRQAMHHADTEVRLAAFRVLTVSAAGGERLDPGVWGLVREWFGSNMNESSAGFRWAMNSLVSKLLIRIRLSSVQAAKYLLKPPSQKAQATPALLLVHEREKEASTLYRAQAQSFIDFLSSDLLEPLELPLSNNHAMVITASELLACLVTEQEWMVANPQTKAFEIEVFSEKMVEHLLACLASNFTDIRERALAILNRSPSPLPGYTTLTARTSLILSAYSVIDRARNAEAEAGKLLLQVVFQKLTTGIDEQLELLWDVMGRLEGHVMRLEGDLVAGLEKWPVHGLLSALCGIVTCLDLKTASTTSPFRATFCDVFALIQRIWTACRPLLCAQDESGPMNEIERTYNLLETADEDGGDHLVVLSSCWRAMRESAKLLATMVTSTSRRTKDGRSDSGLWHDSEVKQIGDLFLIWLTQIRHRGTFSSIAVAFEGYVESIRLPDDGSKAVGTDVPVVADCTYWLERELLDLKNGSQSTTRRSAALPYLVLALVHGHSNMFQSACQRLLDIASSDGNVAAETASTHAFNILKVVILDARQASFFRIVAEQAILISLERSSHRTWSVRNAALLLFAGLTSRLFNKQLIQTVPQRCTSVVAWSDQYPLLLSQFAAQLETPDPTAEMSRTPIFLILLILRNLRAKDHGPPEQRRLQNGIHPYLWSTEWKVREAAAQAIAAMTEPFLRATTITSHIHSALKCTGSKQHNGAHGQLLAARELVRRGSCPTSDDSTLLLRFLRLSTNAVNSTVALEILELSTHENRASILAEANDILSGGTVPSNAPGLDLLQGTLTASSYSNSAGPVTARTEDHWQVALSAAFDDVERTASCGQLRSIGSQSLLSAPSQLWETMASIGTHCIPLQEALLVLKGLAITILEGRLHRHAISSLLEEVKTAVNENKSVDSRVAGLGCLSFCYKDTVARPTIDPSTLFQLHWTLWILLNDDDGDIRQNASLLVAEPEILCREAAAVVFKTRMQSLAKIHSTAWMPLLLRELNHPSFSKDLLKILDDPSKELFATEPPNLFRNGGESLRLLQDVIAAASQEVDLSALPTISIQTPPFTSPIDPQRDTFLRLMQLRSATTYIGGNNTVIP